MMCFGWEMNVTHRGTAMQSSKIDNTCKYDNIVLIEQKALCKRDVCLQTRIRNNFDVLVEKVMIGHDLQLLFGTFYDRIRARTSETFVYKM